MGKRTGNPRGRPKGWDKVKAHDRLRELIWQHQDSLHEAQIKNALGIRYLVSRDKKTGKFTKLTEAEAEARSKDAAWQRDNETLEVWDERPNIQAYSDLMNRTLGKPSEHLEVDAKVTKKVYTWKSSE
jgi:predicted lipase